MHSEPPGVILVRKLTSWPSAAKDMVAREEESGMVAREVVNGTVAREVAKGTVVSQSQGALDFQALIFQHQTLLAQWYRAIGSVRLTPVLAL